MDHRALPLLLSCVAGLCAPSAQAAPLFSASWTQQIQGIDITVTNSGATCTDALATHVQQSIICPTAGLAATGSATSDSYSVGLTMPLLAIDQFTTGGVVALFTHATLEGSQVITGNATAAAASMGVGGRVTVKVGLHAGKPPDASMYLPDGPSLLAFPLSVGLGASSTDAFDILGTAHYITLDFYAWTPGTRTFTGLTSKSAPLTTPTVVAMGSVSLSALGHGIVHLVAPTKISIDGPLAQRRTVSLTDLRLVFVPEPGTLLLLGAAALALPRTRRRS